MKTILLNTAALVFAAIVLTGCRSARGSQLSLGMDASKVIAKFGEPVRKERDSDGSEEWFYEVWQKGETTTETYGSEEPGISISSGSSVSTKYTPVERSISISTDGRVEGIPNGKIIRNKKGARLTASSITSSYKSTTSHH